MCEIALKQVPNYTIIINDNWDSWMQNNHFHFRLEIYTDDVNKLENVYKD